MSIFGTNPLLLPIDNSETGNKGWKKESTMPVAIAVAVIIVICVVIGLTVYFYTRKKYEEILQQKINKKKMKKLSEEVVEDQETVEHLQEPNTDEDEDEISLGSITDESDD